ncbi:ribonuclease E/G [Reyranella sp.]|uniref:ribonuclease E/G n=1 Tax=Reyranella sp. TaxID=1929291 RepID=UPI003784CA71
MARRMLIDASHPEETRVVVVDGTRLEEFDFETATRKPLKGNIYLAKVIRIEPSLQAAFVEYGGNRHGFLAFAEIHPDYYQIPVADRERLIAEQQRLHAEADDDPEPESRPELHDDDIPVGDEEVATDLSVETVAEQASAYDASDAVAAEGIQPPEPSSALPALADSAPVEILVEPAAALETPAERAVAETPVVNSGAPVEVGVGISEPEPQAKPAEIASERLNGPVLDASTEIETPATIDMPSGGPEGDAAGEPSEATPTEAVVETLGGDEATDTREKRERRRRHSVRQYKIQEVIKRRQILLVQVVKEERGNKGAALTTYLSLAGRYCVLMPNAGRGGGISRKISNPADRKRMKEVLSDLDVPQGMGVILRTAGLERSPIDIRRDYEYLSRLWDSIRELTMRSTAPALIYEEGDLIKRSLRDVYDTDIAQVLVEGEAGFTAASEFMRQLVPHQASKVELYKEPIPLFHRYQVESQFDAMHSPTVQLRSGGYIVINPTEALVAIDVNSGRSTRERNIEETALRTNIEAAEEIARQVRLRDLAGLIVIDFIDMEETRHQRQVEHKVKDAMRSDRARIQIGRISAFGLLEMSRQRLRPSLLEHSTESCPHCAGTGRIRSIESAALQALRAIEEEGVRRRAGEIIVSVPPNVALYLLNQKRRTLSEIEYRYNIAVTVEADDELHAADCEIERIRTRRDDRERPQQELARASYEEVGREPANEDVEAPEDGDGALPEGQAAEREEGGEEDGDRDSNRRRRRRRRRRGRREGDGESADHPQAVGDALEGEHDRDDAHDGSAEHGPNGETSVDGLEPVAAAGESDDADATDERDEPIGEERLDDVQTDQRGAEYTEEPQGDEERGDRRRRRGRRGGRRRRRDNGDGERPEGSPLDAQSTDVAPEAQADGESPEAAPLTAEDNAFDPGPPVNIEAEPPVPLSQAPPPPPPSAPPPALDSLVSSSDVPPAIEAAAEPRQPEPPAVLDATPVQPEPPALPPVFEPAPPASEPAPPPVPVITAPPEKPRRGWWRR